MGYSAQAFIDHDVAVTRLVDEEREVTVSVATSIGNRAFEMRVRGKNILYFPFANAGALNQDPRSLNGIPFLAPWANRIGGGFRAAGRKVRFDQNRGNLRLDANGLAIHGMLFSSRLWEVSGAAVDESSAYVTSRLAFWKDPGLMANWPFAHEYEMTYRLAAGVLEVRTTVSNVGDLRMPVAIGFHPYFELPDMPRDDAVLHVPARSRVETDNRLLATGELTPAGLPDRVSLREHRFDDGFTDLVRGPDGKAVFYLEGGGRRIDVSYGPRYTVAVIYAPPGHNYVCMEPMSSVTDGINLAGAGKYPQLQWIAPGESWEESFWIETTGF